MAKQDIFKLFFIESREDILSKGVFEVSFICLETFRRRKGVEKISG